MVLTLACQSINQPEEYLTHIDPYSISSAENVILSYDQRLHNDRRPRKDNFQYNVALLGMAIGKLGSVSEKYSYYLQEYVDFCNEPAGIEFKYRVKEHKPNRINFTKNITALYKKTGDQKYFSANHHFEKQVETYPKTNTSGFWHEKYYTWQMRLGSAHMTEPFITQFAKKFNRPDRFDLYAWQLMPIYKVILDEMNSLFYHAWDEFREQKWCNPTNGKAQIFRVRSTGWYSKAVTGIMVFLSNDHTNRQDLLIRILKNTVDDCGLVGNRYCDGSYEYYIY